MGEDDGLRGGGGRSCGRELRSDGGELGGFLNQAAVTAGARVWATVGFWGGGIGWLCGSGWSREWRRAAVIGRDGSGQGGGCSGELSDQAVGVPVATVLVFGRLLVVTQIYHSYSNSLVMKKYGPCRYWSDVGVPCCPKRLKHHFFGFGCAFWSTVEDALRT